MSVTLTLIITHWPSSPASHSAHRHTRRGHAQSLTLEYTDIKEAQDTFQPLRSIMVHSFPTIVLWWKVQL